MGKFYSIYVVIGFHLAVKREQSSLGFPAWRTICDWLDEDISVAVPSENPSKDVSLKNPEIPKLDNYKFPADEKFWSSFPKKELPGTAETEVLTH